MHAPRAHAVAERVIGTLGRACLDHRVIANERHLSAVLAELVQHANTQRPDRTLRPATPQPVVRSTTGSIPVRPVLGGLPHAYDRAA
jgi:hypothetical protein